MGHNSYANMPASINKQQKIIADYQQNLEIHEEHFDVFVGRKLRDVHQELKNAPFCETNQQITKVTSCCYFHQKKLCCLCLENGKEHLINTNVWERPFFIKRQTPVPPYLKTNRCDSVYLSPKMCEIIAEVNDFINTKKECGIDVQCEIEMQ